MAISIKGIFRGLKTIAQIFTVQREHEIGIEIGYPTDVRHVSHIGLGATGSCPSWMNEFRGVEEVSLAAGGASISSAEQSKHTSWASLDFEQPVGGVPPPTEASSAVHDAAIAGPATKRGAAKKPATRPKKARAPSPNSSARSSSWRSTASFATACSDSGELRAA